MDNNTMLGKVVRMLVTVPAEKLGILADMSEKLASDAGAEWYENLRKFMRKEACWVSVTAQATVETIRIMIVDATMSLQDMIEAGNYDWVNDDITAKRFPITADDGGEWEYDLWDPKGSISSSDAIERMKGDDKDNPWMPARTAHLLRFGVMDPEAQRKNPIVALGSVAKVRGDRLVPDLLGNVSERSLNLNWWDDDWDSHYRFLRVRKVKKS